MRIPGLLFLMLVFFYAEGYSQSCPNTHVVNLSASADNSVSITDKRDGNCCSGTNCINFDITVNPASDLINFNADQITGASFYSVNCGPQIPIGTPACITGLTNVKISFCKPGNNIVTYTITSLTA